MKLTIEIMAYLVVITLQKMEQLEKEFEEMLIKTQNTELIDKYADLKANIYESFKAIIKSMNAHICN